MGIRAWQEVAGVVGIFVLLTCVITVTIWQVAASIRAKADIAREAAYQQLAHRAVSTQEKLERDLVEARSQLTDLQSRLTSVEHVLREVE
ncbi:hypothetical protein [Actinokineospora globicatena]|uniref:Secreted protein n=1 Tax=Actinokineospora globicatena TaxID=103729 RepID=A0A9W6QRB8_9PSEU|nr:hypothetical protein [Actinokineospora globicatena]GLW93202.1 hypothetical protein Aglo03_40180 [Actinokineospora globicatena]